MSVDSTSESEESSSALEETRIILNDEILLDAVDHQSRATAANLILESKAIRTRSLNQSTRKSTEPSIKNWFLPESNYDVSRVHNALLRERVVVERYNLKLRNKDLLTLVDKSWLNDEVINFYGEFCMERSTDNPNKFPKIHVFSTFFLNNLRKKGFKL